MLWIAASTGSAHIASNSFLELTVRGRTLSGSIEIAVRDAELAVGVDSNGDGRVTWGELRSAGPALAQYLGAHVKFFAPDVNCPAQFGGIQVDQRVDGNYAWVSVSARCPLEPGHMKIRYDVLSGIDPSHRGLLKLVTASGVQTAVLGRDGLVELTIGHSSQWSTFREFFVAGTQHIWSGIDHLLFLLSLLLPAVLMRRHGKWEAVATARPAFLSILKVVTGFTIAHSITLSLAALDVVRLPSRLTESVIAASIMVAALNNIFPVVTEGRARIAFAFGLLHGFGFASVLADMGLPAGARTVALVSFNLGIEAGQLAVVSAVMPIAYLLRRGVGYRQTVLPWGSAAIATLALVWFVQRAFLAP